MTKDQAAIYGTIAEMNTSITDGSFVPISSGVDVAKLVEGDEDPMFVTLEVLHEATSANRNRYSSSLIESIKEQIMSKIPDGYFGHIPESDRPTAHPESQTLWLGAETKLIDGKTHLFAKGYILPTADKLKSYLRKSVAAGKKVGVSIYGQAEHKWDKLAKVRDILDFDLESIDWARPGAEGFAPTTGLFIAKEQKDTIMTKDELLAKLKEMGETEEFTADEIKEALPKVEFTAPVEDKEPVEVTEMKSELESNKTTLGEMKAENKALYESYIDTQVSGVITKPSARRAFKMFVLQEMKGEMNKTAIDSAITSVLNSDEGKTYIQEMVKPEKFSHKQDNHNPVNNKKTGIKVVSRD